MSDKIIRILHLYSNDMNIYGDRGNILVLKRRLQWYGYTPEIVEYNPGDKFPDNIDIVVVGAFSALGGSKFDLEGSLYVKNDISD